MKNVEPNGCHNCKEAIIDPNIKLAVGCDQGDMYMVVCKRHNYLDWKLRKEGEE